MTFELPWVIGLTSKEVEDLRNKKRQLTQYGQEKIRKLMNKPDYQLIAKELYETLKELREVVDDAKGAEYISRWNKSMPRVDAAIEYYEDAVK